MKETLSLIADELDEAVGDIALSQITQQEVYRLLMAAQSAIAAIRIAAELLNQGKDSNANNH